MRRVLVVGLAALLMPAMASAQTEPTPLADFTSLCEETASTGFNWEGGEWVQRNFSPQKFIVRKINRAEDRPKQGYDNLCLEANREEGQGCYSVAPPGEPQRFRWCDEYLDHGAWGNLTRIDCSATLWFNVFSFLPSGPFQRSFFPWEEVQSRGSARLTLGHGKCTIIQ